MGERRPRRTLVTIGVSALFATSSLATIEGGAAAQGPSPALVDPERAVSHFLCYRGRMAGFPDPQTAPVVELTGATLNATAQVRAGRAFCNPVQKKKGKKVLARIRSNRQHFKAYDILVDGIFKNGEVVISNQFDRGQVQSLTVLGQPNTLLVPSRKLPHRFPNGLDHYVCRTVIDHEGFDGQFKLKDQFRRYRKMKVGDPIRFCSPTGKQHGGRSFAVRRPLVHLVCYGLEERSVRFRRKASNQFEKKRSFTAKTTLFLCVPSVRVDPS